MIKPWVITNFLTNLQDGFYIDINSDSEETSPTKILDNNYRWRGIYVNSTCPSDRGLMCKYVGLNVLKDKNELLNIIYNTHPGTMVHYMFINNIDNLEQLFNNIYELDVIEKYKVQTIYPHLNFISLEICGWVDDKLINQLYEQFDLTLYNKNDKCYKFTNEIFSYLIH